MNDVPLGKTGIKVSQISFGTAPLGMPYGPTSDTPEKVLPPDQAVKLLHAALDGGISFFDTAPGYGTAETVVGAAFADRRDRVIISSKLARDAFHDAEGNLCDPDEMARRRRASVTQSLQDLQTDHIDVLLVHQVTDDLIENPAAIEILHQLKKDGLVRTVGLSTYGVDQTRRTIECAHWDVIQLAFNLMDQTNAPNLALAAEKSIGVMVRSVLCKGILTDMKLSMHQALKTVQQYRQSYRDLLDEKTPTLNALAAKFVISQPGVSSALLGLDRMEYLTDALPIAADPILSPQTLEKCRQLAYPDPDFLDMHHWDVMGWLK